MSLKSKLASILSTAHTPAQKINLAFSMFHHHFRHTRLLSYPIKLTVDPCNFCNLSCRLCPVGTRSKLRRQSKMSLDTFRRVIDECGKYLYWLDLFDWGEPLLNENIFRMIQYARRHRPYITMSTNLNIFDNQIALNILTCGPDKLVVSLDGASRETVKKYQTGSDFDLVISNMKRVIEMRRGLKQSTPFVQWNFLVTSDNEHEIDSARSIAKETGVDHLYVGPLRCSMGEELMMDGHAQFKNIERWLPKKEVHSIYDYKKREKKIVKTECSLPWYESIINPDGSVSPCCAVWPEKYDFGSTANSSFRKIWNGRLYREAREAIFCHSESSVICNTCKKNKAFI